MRFSPKFALSLLSALLPLMAEANFSPEQQLKTAVDQLRAGHNNEAFQQLEKLVKQEPNFRLAQLIYGELLAVRSGAHSKLAGQGDAQLKDLLEEAQLRLSPPVKLAGSWRRKAAASPLFSSTLIATTWSDALRARRLS